MPLHTPRVRPVRTLLALLAVVLFPVAAARADGLVIVRNAPPRPVPGHFAFTPLEVTYHRVTVTIDDRVAVTEVDQEFHNASDARLEGEYVFPLPDGASIDSFAMDVNGTMTEAELLPADKARSIYEEIVRQYRDPALLEYVGRGALRARIFPIEPRSKKPVKIRYTQVLTSDSGLTEYVYPLNTEKFSAKPLEQVAITVHLSSKEPIKHVYSPSHDVDVKHCGDRQATVGFEAKDVRPDTDFKLIVSRTGDPVGVDVLTYQALPSESGYFMLLASPGAASVSTTERVQNQDVVFAIDTSGSMAGEKLEQAKKALRFCVASLNPGDRFDVVRFSTEAEPLFGSLREIPAATTDPRTDREEAYRFIDDLKAVGGTAIQDALKTALSLRPREELKDGIGLPPSKPFVVVFLTDGQPTVGETNEDRLVAEVARLAPQDKVEAPVRVFSFGIGGDVNTHLLDRIANDTKAFSQYVTAKEDIEVKVGSFYTKIQSPVLTNVKLALDAPGFRVTNVYPSEMPDLYKGQTLVAFGRYEDAPHARSGPVGRPSVTVSGTVNGQPFTFTRDIAFPSAGPGGEQNPLSRAFIPRLWATRRVGWLLDEIRLRGESPELKDEVVRLAREHGIVTPYTAYLILEDEQRRNVPVTLRSFQELEATAAARENVFDFYASASASSPRLEKAGDRAVANARAAGALKQSVNEAQAQNDLGLAKPQQTVAGAPVAGQDGALGYRTRQNFAQQVRVLNGKAFYQNGARWTDAAAQTQAATQPAQKQREVTFNSDEYFALLRNHPTAAPWLSLGEEVDVVIGDTLYQIRAGG